MIFIYKSFLFKSSFGALLFLCFTFLSSFSFKNNGNTEPEYRLSSYRDKDTVKVDYFLSHKNLSVIYVGKNSQFDGDEYKVKSYQLLIIPKVGEAVAFTFKGNLLSESIIPYIQPGSKVVFQNVAYIKNDNSIGLLKENLVYIE